MSFLNDLFQTEAKDWQFEIIPFDKTPKDVVYKTVEPNTEYVNIILKTFRIVLTRKMATKFYPAVYSFISLPHKKTGTAEFKVITTANKLKELDSANQEDVINHNQRLLGPMPFRAADIELEIGLFSIKSVDLVAPFLSLLTDISKLSGVGSFTSALPYISIINDGIQKITSTDRSQLEIGISTKLNKLETGYFVVIKADKGQVDFSKLTIGSEGKVHYEGTPVTKYPYMVFEISSTKQKDDYFKIKDVSDAYADLQAVVEKAEGVIPTKAALSVFKRKTLMSGDLILTDAERICKLVEDEINTIVDTTVASLANQTKLKNLMEYDLYK